MQLQSLVQVRNKKYTTLWFLTGLKLCAPPPLNPHRFLGRNQSQCLVFIHLDVCVGIYEAYPQVTCYNYEVPLFLAQFFFFNFTFHFLLTR